MDKLPEIITQSQRRPHVQLGGPLPSSPLLFYGGGVNYLAISGVSIPVRGSIDPVYVHDPRLVGAYARAARTISPPDLPSSDVMFKEQYGSIPRQLLAFNCELNIYLPSGRCKDLSNFDQGWEDYVLIFSRGLVTSRDLGDVFSFDGDDAIETTLNVTWDTIYPVGTLGFSRVPDTTARNNISDVTYGNRVICGQCGPADDGSGLKYFLEIGDAGATQKPRVLYQLVNGGAISSIDIAVAASGEAPTAIGVMGQYLVVISPTAVSPTAGGMYYALISPVTGVPGTFTKVTTGFTAAQEPRDITVVNQRLAFICCDGGEILKLEDVPSGPTSMGLVASGDLSQIDSLGETIIAVGVGGILVSQNSGLTFGPSPTEPSSEDEATITIMDKLRWWVGLASGGGLWYTLDGGNTWVKSALPGTTSPSIRATAAATQEVLYVGFYETAPGLATSIDGGATWVNAANVSPRIQNLSVTGLADVRHIAVPISNNQGIAANNVIIGGNGTGVAGYLAIGTGNTF